MNLIIICFVLVEVYEVMGKDIDNVIYQEMCLLVCVQCYVEYYFNKDKVKGVNYLMFFWVNGMIVENVEEYYDNILFVDWIYLFSKIFMLKV